MIYRIPYDPDSDTVFRIVLDHIEVVFHVYFEPINPEIQKVIGDQDYDGFFYADLLSNTFQIKGIRLTMGCDLLQPYGLTDFGSLFVYSLDGKLHNVAAENLGKELFIGYRTFDHVETT